MPGNSAARLLTMSCSNQTKYCGFGDFGLDFGSLTELCRGTS